MKDADSPLARVSFWALAPSVGGTSRVAESPTPTRSTSGKPSRVQAALWLVKATGTSPVSPAAGACAGGVRPAVPALGRGAGGAAEVAAALRLGGGGAAEGGGAAVVGAPGGAPAGVSAAPRAARAPPLSSRHEWQIPPVAM